MKKLGFGCMRLPINEDKSVNLEEFKEMADNFIKQGFTYFDTAYMYHNGKSEISLREAVVKRYPRDAFTVADKMPTMMLKKEEDVDRIFHEQLERCGVDYFDFYLLHSLDSHNYVLAEKFNAFDYVFKKKAEGKVKQVGFSFHDNAKLLDEILTKYPDFDFVQLQINYLDWDDEGIQSGKCYDVAIKHNKKIVVMEPVKGGTLVKIPTTAKKIFHDANPAVSIPSWAIRFAASLDSVFVVLSGMSNTAQLTDNTGYMSDFTPLTESEKKTIYEAKKAIKKFISIPCTGCNYCGPECPKNIAIPQYFSLYNNEKMFPPEDFPSQRMYYNNLATQYGKASDCIKCGKCEKMCPQHLTIRKYLETIAANFEK